MEELLEEALLLVMIFTFSIWETVRIKLSGWLFQSLDQLQEEDMVIQLFSQSHTFLYSEETQAKRQ